MNKVKNESANIEKNARGIILLFPHQWVEVFNYFCTVFIQNTMPDRHTFSSCKFALSAAQATIFRHLPPPIFLIIS